MTQIPTDAIWQDLKMVIKKQKEKDAATPSGSQSGIGQNSVSAIKNTATTNVPHRVDLAERQLFGMLFVMEKEKGASEKEKSIAEYRDQLKKIAGDTYAERVTRAESIKSDLMFEAEKYFGTDQSRWDFHMKELLLNFEEDVINAELFQAMNDLRQAEKAGDQARGQECAKKCQVLSIRKAEILKKRK